MNENIDLTKILKNCPNSTKLYSLVHGEVNFQNSDFSLIYPIVVKLKNGNLECFTSNGKLFNNYGGECILFPSREQRDWSKFTAPWYKKEKFDPKTLKPFDRVIARDSSAYSWRCAFYSHTKENGNPFRYVTENSAYEFCVPYNDDTKHLVGTTEEAPEYYRYWED